MCAVVEALSSYCYRVPFCIFAELNMSYKDFISEFDPFTATKTVGPTLTREYTERLDASLKFFLSFDT